MSPSIYTALVDSLFQDPGPMFVGAVCAGLAAIMTVFLLLPMSLLFNWRLAVVLIVVSVIFGILTRLVIRKTER